MGGVCECRQRAVSASKCGCVAYMCSYFLYVVSIVYHISYSGLQVSFVNGTATTRGGTHVDYVADQISNHVRDFVKRKDVDTNAKMKLHFVRDILNREDVNKNAKMKLQTVRDIVNSTDVDENAKLKLHTVRGYLWIFVNALIENPSFDSQTKEALTTPEGSFGSTCYLSDDFLNKGMRFLNFDILD